MHAREGYQALATREFGILARRGRFHTASARSGLSSHPNLTTMILRKHRPVYFLPRERVPAGFRYPDSYKAFSQRGTPMVGPVNEDWCVLGDDEVEAMLAYACKLSPTKALVPFMRRNGEDGVACFDGSALSDDPEVFIFNYSVEVGCGPTHKTFSEWLAQIPPSDDEDA